jgi:hypothetical protein
MIDITTKPDHGEQLVNKEGKALTALQLYLDDITLALNADRTNLKDYTVITVPDASSGYGMIMVTDEAGGAVPAFSDLTDWRRVTDRAVIS